MASSDWSNFCARVNNQMWLGRAILIIFKRVRQCHIYCRGGLGSRPIHQLIERQFHAQRLIYSGTLNWTEWMYAVSILFDLRCQFCLVTQYVKMYFIHYRHTTCQFIDHMIRQFVPTYIVSIITCRHQSIHNLVILAKMYVVSILSDHTMGQNSIHALSTKSLSLIL